MKANKFILSLLSLLLVLQAFSLEPPTLQCLQLRHNNERLFVAWDNSADCAQTTKYLVYVNNQLVDSILPNASVTLCNLGGKLINNIQTANAYSCFIRAVDAAGNTSQSNTIQTISITVTPSADSSLAYLSWESPSSSSLAGNWSSHFFIYKKRAYEADFTNTPIATVPNTQLTYTDTADVCYDEISYQVGITNQYGISDNCIFKTMIGSAIFVDRQQPQTPVLDSVTTDENNRVALGFHAPEPSMFGYIVYYEENGWIPIDTIFNTTYWIDPNGGDRCYRIAVLDSCTNSSSITVNEQCNLKLYLDGADACNQKANIHWSTYPNLTGGVDHYEVFASTDGGNTYQSYGTVQGNSFQMNDMQINTPYRVFVRVYNTGGTITASSNRINISLDGDASSDMTYIRSVSVENNRRARIVVHTSGDSLAFESITLQKSSNGIDFTPLQTLGHHTSSGYEFVDSTSDFTSQVVYYQTFVINDCGTESGFSNVAHNILLTGEATTAQGNAMQWNNYGEWNGGVDFYTLYRKLEIEDDFGEMPDVLWPTTLNTYYDDVSQLYETGAKFAYYVTAKEVTNDYGFSDESVSNSIILEQMPNTYIPNAFTPLQTINKVFMPKNAFVSGDGYTFSIYSRFGDLFFTTHDPYQGWDGYFNGRVAPMGVYIYKLTYKLPDGTIYKKDGSCTLLH